MEDGRNSSSSISSTSGQQQQDLVVAGEAFCPGGGGGGGGAGWGTLEELLLIGAIIRHGSGDWAVVAGELQSRAKLLSMPPAYFSPEACKNKFDGLSGRYGSLGYRSSSGGGAAGGGRDKEPENHPAWFEDIRRRRVAQLKRELERHDGCIVSLSNKLKRLKAERAQSLQTPNKQQHHVAAAPAPAAAGKAIPDDSSALAVATESQKPLDSSKAEPETPQADGPVDEGIKPSASPPVLDPAASAHETPPSEPPPATSEEEAEEADASSVEAVVEAAPQELLIDEKDAATAAAADAPETDGSVGVEPPPPEAAEAAEPVVVETDRSIDDDEIGVGIGEKAVESTQDEGITPDSGTEKFAVAAAESLVPEEAEVAKSVEVVDEERPSVDDSAVVAVDPVCTSSDPVVNTAEATESLDPKPAVESEQRDDAALNTEDVVEEAAMEEMEGNPDMDSKDEELAKLDESPEHPGGLDAQVETEEEKKSQEVDAKAEELHDEADAIKGVATEEENEVVNAADVDMVCLKNEAADLRAEDDDKGDDLQAAAGKNEGPLLSKVELKSSEEAAEMETEETAVADASRKDEDAMDVDEAPVVRESAEVAGAAALAEAVESLEPSQAEGLDVEPVPVVVQANEVERDQPADEDVKNMEAEDAVELHPETTNSGVVDSLETQKEAEAAVVDEPMDPEKALAPGAAGGIEPANVALSVPAAEVEAVQEKNTVDSDFVEPASEAAAAAPEAASERTEAAADGSHQLESAVVLSEVVDPSAVSIEERPLPGDAGDAAEAEEALDLASKDATPLPPAEDGAAAVEATDSEAITAEDVGVKVVGEGGQLVVDIIGEPLDQPVEPSRPEAAEEEATPAEEKEASSSAVQSSSSQGTTTKQSAYKEKSDESQGGGARQAESVEKPETVVCKASRQDVGSPVSGNEDFQEEKDEGSGSAQEQSKDGSQVEKSEVGGSQVDGPEDTSPTSRRLKKESKLPGKLQPLLECLRTICGHKFAPLFKQRQESQDDPRYDQVIRRHVDLNMIRARLEEGGYSGSLEFFRDLLLVFNNSIVFYPRESQEYNAAVALRKLTLEEMDRILQAEVLMKQDRPATRKRDSKRPMESVPVSVPAVPAAVPAATATTTSRAGVTSSSSGKLRQGNVGGGGLELSTSDNSKSKSASLSLGVPSSRGGEEEDAREGEPEVEGKSTAKPLKAYGRKNRGDAAQQEARRAAAGKGVARERPKESLEAIVKKIGKAEEAAAALAKETAAAAAAAKETSSKASAAKETPAKAREAKEKAAAAAADASKASSKAPQAAGEAPAPTTSIVRGARNKRSSVKEATQRPGKRTRRI